MNHGLGVKNSWHLLQPRSAGVSWGPAAACASHGAGGRAEVRPSPPAAGGAAPAPQRALHHPLVGSSAALVDD